MPTVTLTLQAADDLDADGPGAANTGSTDGGSIEEMNGGFSNSVNLAASTTYFMGANNNDGLSATENNFVSFIIPKTGTVTKMYFIVYIGGTTPSSASVTITLRINGADTSVVISSDWSTEGTNGAALISTGTASVSQGDKGSIKIVTPAWGTPPTGVRLFWSLQIT